MKRIIAALMLAVFLVALSAASAAEPGSAQDFLVSKSYVENTFGPAAIQEVGGELTSILEGVYDDAVASSGLRPNPGYSFASGYTAINLKIGQTVSLVTGSSFILLSGSVTLSVEAGEVIKIASASVTPDGSVPEADLRYFCAEDTRALLTAGGSATVLVNGDFRRGGSIRVEDMYLDVNVGDWFYGAVQFVVEHELFHDLDEEYFRPAEFADRATFVYALWVLSGRPAAEYDGSFSDVQEEDWFAEAVAWGAENDIVRGTGNGKFKPHEPAEREQEAAFLHRYIMYLGYDGAATGDVTTFDDYEDISDWALDDMKWAVGDGILIGTERNMLNPHLSGRRDEVATMMMRIAERIQ